MRHSLYIGGLHVGGLRALLAAAASTAALFGSPTLAQASGEDAVARCRTLMTDAARISCLEEALTGSRPTVAPAPQTDAARAAAAEGMAPTPVGTASAAPAPQELERRGLGLPGVPFIGGGGGQRAAVASDSPEAEEFGAQQVAIRDNAPEVIPTLTARVVEVDVVPYRRLQVVLDNGQVWRQTGSDDRDWEPARYDEPENVEIWASRTGGYRMRFVDDQNITMRVERIQ